MAELNVTAGAVQVRALFLPEFRTGTKDLPHYLQEYVDDPSIFDGYDEDRESADADLVEWKQKGRFVFTWHGYPTG